MRSSVCQQGRLRSHQVQALGSIDSKMMVIFLYVEDFSFSLTRITKAPRPAADLIPDGYGLASYIILNGV